MLAMPARERVATASWLVKLAVKLRDSFVQPCAVITASLIISGFTAASPTSGQSRGQSLTSPSGQSAIHSSPR